MIFLNGGTFCNCAFRPGVKTGFEGIAIGSGDQPGVTLSITHYSLLNVSAGLADAVLNVCDVIVVKPIVSKTIKLNITSETPGLTA